MFFVYVLKSKKIEKNYIGSTQDLTKRLERHNACKVRSTKTGVPWELIYYEAYSSKRLARKTELFYKTSQGRRQLGKKLELN